MCLRSTIEYLGMPKQAPKFQLTKEEIEDLARCKNFTTQIWATNKGGRTSLPYAFSEQGIYMLN